MARQFFEKVTRETWTVDGIVLEFTFMEVKNMRGDKDWICDP